MGRPRKWGVFEVTMTLNSALEDAKAEAESLRDEIEEWKSNIEGTPAENTGKGEQLEEALGYLEDAVNYLEDVEVDNPVMDSEVGVLINKQRQLSRAARRDNTTSMLDAVANTLEPLADDDSYDEEEAEIFREAAESIRNAIDYLDSVEFPGMYG